MTITINWATRVVSVPKVDTLLLQSTPIEIRELNLNTFRLTLKDLEDGEEGMSYPDTHRHNAAVSVGGVTLALVVELINNYSVTFENGNYAVNLVGANSNVADRVNLNQVSIRSANSAGLVQTREIEFAAFDGVVHFDAVNGVGGTGYPTGTRQSPSNNLADTVLIAGVRGLNAIKILSSLDIGPTASLAGMVVKSDNWLVVTVAAGASINYTEFEKVTLYGVMSGLWNVLVDCWIYDITNFCGWVRAGSIVAVTLAPYTVENTGNSYFDNILPMFAGVTSNITLNTDTKTSITSCNDIVTLHGLTAGSLVNCGLQEGVLYVAATCVGGSIAVSGVGEIESNLGAASLDFHGLVNPETVWANTTGAATATWTALIGRILQNKQITDPVTGTITVFADDGVTPLLTAALFEDAAGTQAYRGRGAERRNRLV